MKIVQRTIIQRKDFGPFLFSLFLLAFIRIFLIENVFTKTSKKVNMLFKSVNGRVGRVFLQF